MKKFFVRCFFCSMPSILFGVLGCVIHPLFGAFIAGVVFKFGWSITAPVAERGEGI